MKFDNFNVIENFDNLGTGGSEKVAPPPFEQDEKSEVHCRGNNFPTISK